LHTEGQSGTARALGVALRSQSPIERARDRLKRRQVFYTPM